MGGKNCQCFFRSDVASDERPDMLGQMRVPSATDDVTFLAYLNRQRSRGSIQLNDEDRYTVPTIHLNFFSDPDNKDIEAVKYAVKAAGELIKTEVFQNIGMYQTFGPDDPSDDASIEEYVRTNTVSGDHFYWNL
eukprot:TRINITY_DN3982_c0_g1_i2.p1 TRINITY_DN3982_c0_g1~~TRINITY_DN3982_c0_g1_i2.p1  ORF type:complete len:153 (+),score=37.10 TRINITY_DN3982_c0_g1_i2:59-460(+)